MKSFGQGMRLIDDGIMRLIVRAVRGAADIFNRRPVLAPKVFRCGIHPPRSKPICPSSTQTSAYCSASRPRD
jgi:hypothetical protein